MSTIATINAGDALEPLSRNNLNNNFAALNADKLEVDGVTKANLDANGDVGTGPGQVSQGDHSHAHSDITGISANDHHSESHTVASHSDTTATGTELETLTDGSNADALHAHTGSGLDLTRVITENFSAWSAGTIPDRYEKGGTLPTGFSVDGWDYLILGNDGDSHVAFRGFAVNGDPMISSFWDKTFRFHVSASYLFAGSSTTGTHSLFVGVGERQSVTSVKKFVGFEFEYSAEAGTVRSVVHDGTTLTRTTVIGSTPTNSSPMDIVIEYDGGVEIRFILNGVLVDTVSTDLPSGDSASNEMNYWEFAHDNVASGSASRLMGLQGIAAVSLIIE